MWCRSSSNAPSADIAKSVDKLLSKGADQRGTEGCRLEHPHIHRTWMAVDQADLVIEAATENPELKLKIFRDLDQRTRPQAILASNTSSISITKIAAVTTRPDQVIGMHFMNPVPLDAPGGGDPRPGDLR